MQRHEGPSPKSLDSDEDLKPLHTIFVAILRFVTIYTLFGSVGKNSVFFLSKTAFLGQDALLVVYISYYT